MSGWNLIMDPNELEHTGKIVFAEYENLKALDSDSHWTDRIRFKSTDYEVRSSGSSYGSDHHQTYSLVCKSDRGPDKKLVTYATRSGTSNEFDKFYRYGDLLRSLVPIKDISANTLAELKEIREKVEKLDASDISNNTLHYFGNSTVTHDLGDGQSLKITNPGRNNPYWHFEIYSERDKDFGTYATGSSFEDVEIKKATCLSKDDRVNISSGTVKDALLKHMDERIKMHTDISKVFTLPKDIPLERVIEAQTKPRFQISEKMIDMPSSALYDIEIVREMNPLKHPSGRKGSELPESVKKILNVNLDDVNSQERSDMGLGE